MHRSVHTRQLSSRCSRHSLNSLDPLKRSARPPIITLSCLNNPCIRRQTFSTCLRNLATAAPSTLKLSAKVPSPVIHEEELAIWEQNAGRAAAKPEAAFQADTDALTDLCQKQVNYWHRKQPLTDSQIDAIKQIAKLSILHRSKGLTSFASILNNAKLFDPELVYLTAQTMFRSIPDSAGPRESIVEPEIYELGLVLRRRLFYVGLLAGHVQSALCLWWSFSYNTPAGKAEKDMILRALDSAKAKTISPKMLALVEAVIADGTGDISQARKQFDTLDITDFAEYDLLWKKRGEYFFAIDQEKALAWIWAGRELFSAPVIVAMLEEFLNYTQDQHMKIRISIYLLCYSPNYTYKTIAKLYENVGDKMMAREYHELSGALGDKESQTWMLEYLQSVIRSSWGKRPDLSKQLESWKMMLSK